MGHLKTLGRRKTSTINSALRVAIKNAKINLLLESLQRKFTEMAGPKGPSENLKKSTHYVEWGLPFKVTLKNLKKT